MLTYFSVKEVHGTVTREVDVPGMDVDVGTPDTAQAREKWAILRMTTRIRATTLRSQDPAQLLRIQDLIPNIQEMTLQKFLC